MGGFRYGVIAGAIGEAHERQGFLKAARNILPFFRLPANHETELELFAHDASPSRMLGRRWR